MTKGKISYRYFVYGITVESELFFPELMPTLDEPEVHIKFDDGSGDLNLQGFFEFPVKDIANFQIGKNSIIITPFTQDEALLRVLILGSCFGALINLRNELAFHGSAIAYKGHAMLFSGPSGSGKSTMASSFLQQGYKLISDDVCVISFAHKVPEVNPSYPQIKLLEDAASHIDLKANMMYQNKYFFDVKDHFFSHSLPLKFVFLLERGRTKTAIEEVKGTEKFNALAEQTFRPQFINRLNIQPEHFTKITSMAESRVFRLFYANDLGNSMQVVKSLIHFFKEQGL